MNELLNDLKLKKEKQLHYLHMKGRMREGPENQPCRNAYFWLIVTFGMYYLSKFANYTQ